MKPSGLKFKWSRSWGVPAQTFGDFYYALKTRTPEELVKAARNKRSPVHKLFEWNDRRAAHEHRLVQARVMVNSLEVEIITPKGKPTNVVAFIRSSSRGGHHVATPEAKPEDLTARMRKCWTDMLRFRARYKDLEMVGAVVSAIEDVDRRLTRAHGRARKRAA